MTKSRKHSALNEVLSPDQILDIVGRQYDIGRLKSCKLIRKGFNYNYFIEAENARFVLRSYLNGKYYIRDPHDFSFELELLDFLHKKGLPVVEPVLNNQQNYLASETNGRETRYFALFHFIDGLDVKSAKNKGYFKPKHVGEIGETIALIHQEADNFNCSHHRYHLNLETYVLEEPIRFFEHLMREKEMGDLVFLRPKIEDYKNRLSVLKKEKPSYGLIHADLNPNNVLCTPDGKQFIIDFDHCAYGWRAYELAIAAFNNPNMQNDFLSGYETVRPLQQEEKELMPLFSKLAQLWDHFDMAQFVPLWGESLPDERLTDFKRDLLSIVSP